jgi:hypothetical protein
MLEPEWTKSTEVHGAKRSAAASVAVDANAAVLEQTAAQVLVDLAHHEARQSASRLGALLELARVRRDGTVEHRLLGTMGGAV